VAPAALALAACGPEASAPDGSVPAAAAPWFREVARERGLDWTHVRAREPRYWFPEIMGGGVGLLDLDGDGRLDVYLVQSGDLSAPGGAGSRVFHNEGGARFADVTERAGGNDTGYGMGCACGDADGDGDTDVFVTRVGPDALWRNDGGVLGDATAEAGVGDPAWGTSAAWLDPDADGDLDLFVANYVRWSAASELTCRSPQGGQDYCSPLNYDAPTRDTLYRNDGAGRFTDVSEAAGLGAAFGNGLGVVPGDFDADGRLDVYVANDMMPNQLWMNQGELVFRDRALLAGCAVNMDGTAQAGMGVAAIDVEDDGDLDLFVTHLRDETNTLYRNERGLFTDHTGPLGLGTPSLPFTGFGLAFGDFDRDGALDLYVVNGAVTRNRTLYDPADPYAEPDQLYRGTRTATGAARFEEVLPRGGVAAPRIGNGRGAACGDLDDDGDLDLVVVENGAHVSLFENVHPAAGHWIGLAVLEPNGRAALGARVELTSGARTFHRTVESAGSYASSHDPRVHCGLGPDASPVTVTVHWLGAPAERFGPLAVDQRHALRRGTGSPLR